jgi:hypothetical protein
LGGSNEIEEAPKSSRNWPNVGMREGLTPILELKGTDGLSDMSMTSAKEDIKRKISSSRWMMDLVAFAPLAICRRATV